MGVVQREPSNEKAIWDHETRAADKLDPRLFFEGQFFANKVDPHVTIVDIPIPEHERVEADVEVPLQFLQER